MSKIITSWILFFNLSVIFSQSFLVKTSGELIRCEKIVLKGEKLVYQPRNVVDNIEIFRGDVSEYYSDLKGIRYFYKNGFKERLIEGRIKVYRDIVEGEMDRKSIIGQLNKRYARWYLEKDSKLHHVFNQSLPSDNLNSLDEDTFEELISDDSLANREFKGHKTRKLEATLRILKDYNTRFYFKNKKELDKNSKLSKVIIFRDNRKESKAPIHFTINNKPYTLNRNSKIELEIPNNEESIICISNDIYGTCDLLISSDLFTKYYELKYNKNKEASISKVNGRSQYRKTRLEYYDKRAKQ